jgi:hypothetical protein
LKIGAQRSARSWKNMLLIWFVILVITSAFTSPLKHILNTGFGSSMITEKLRDGIFFEAFTDLGPVFESVRSVFSSGLFSLILISFILNAFFTGGLFDSVRFENAGTSVKEFLKACAKNFWSYFVILILTGFLILFTAVLISAVPMIFIDMESDRIERTIIISGITVTAIYIIILPAFLLIADYSRAWKAANEGKGAFNAFGHGLSLTFGHFRSSWSLMLILLAVNALYMWLVFSVLSGATPVTGWGVFMFFLISQLMFMVRIMLKIYRYSCVTCLLEQGYQISKP